MSFQFRTFKVGSEQTTVPSLRNPATVSPHAESEHIPVQLETYGLGFPAAMHDPSGFMPTAKWSPAATTFFLPYSSARLCEVAGDGIETGAAAVGAAVVATVGTVVGVVAANAAVLVSSAGLLAFAHISAPHSTTAMTAAAAIQSFFPDFSPAFGFGSD